MLLLSFPCARSRGSSSPRQRPGGQRERILYKKWLDKIAHVCLSQCTLYLCLVLLQYHNNKTCMSIPRLRFDILDHLKIIFERRIYGEKDQVRSLLNGAKHLQCLLRAGADKYVMADLLQMNLQERADHTRRVNHQNTPTHNDTSSAIPCRIESSLPAAVRSH